MAGKHFVLLDKALGLLGNPFKIMFLTQRQFVLAHIDRCFRSTFFTFHGNTLSLRATEGSEAIFDSTARLLRRIERSSQRHEPPEITAINLTSSPSFKISSSRIISPFRVAITDSGTTLIFCNAERSVIPGFTSCSLFRKINLTKGDSL